MVEQQGAIAVGKAWVSTTALPPDRQTARWHKALANPVHSLRGAAAASGAARRTSGDTG